MNSRKKNIIITSLVIFIVIVTNIFTFVLAGGGFGTKGIVGIKNSKDVEYINKLLSLKNRLESDFYQKVDEDKLWEGAIKGLYQGAGDDYTYYMNKKEFDEYSSSFNSSYQGIGVQIIQTNDGYAEIETVFPGSPAEKALVKSGDIIIEVNKKSTKGMTLNEVSNNLRGEKGTKASFKVLRSGKTLEFSVVRDTIKIETVTYKNMDGIGYIRITQFDKGTGDAYISALNKLKKENIKGLIIDLRDNPGGLVNEATQIANTILPKGSVIYSGQNKKGKTQTVKDTTDEKLNIPLVVLINGSSASSSEILASSIKDNKAGTLVGVKSYGKGIIQQFGPVPEGGGVSITVEEYVSANGDKIHKLGINPDVIIALSSDKPVSIIEFKNDLQLKEAIKIINKK